MKLLIALVCLVSVSFVLADPLLQEGDDRKFCIVYEHLYDKFGLVPGATVVEVKRKIGLLAPTMPPPGPGEPSFETYKAVLLSDEKENRDRVYTSKCTTLKTTAVLGEVLGTLTATVLGTLIVEMYTFVTAAPIPLTLLLQWCVLYYLIENQRVNQRLFVYSFVKQQGVIAVFQMFCGPLPGFLGYLNILVASFMSVKYC
jgi:hypothetical protein